MYKHGLKRVLDFFVSLIALPFWLVLLFVLAPIIYFSDRGSVFYCAPRLGRDGKTFNMYKFRSMKMNVPDIRNADGSTFNAEDDPRLTKIGKFLRKTSLDETPQLLNVLKGDMSLIGPRPDLPEHFELYVDNESRKLEVRPGITGYSQAYFRNNIPWKERIQKDIYYIDHLTFALDVKVLFRTAMSVLRSENVYIQQEESADRK